MGQLCIYLTPFASDYSGVCSALYDLDCMIAINDAGCCTSHYVYYDEPRWEDGVHPVFSTSIRNADCVLGADEKIINTICEAADSIDSQMLALIGTPVPALIGMDLNGMARVIEKRINRPCLGFNTSGFYYYDKGIYMAGKALVDRFANDMDVVPGRVNICGMTPLDYCYDSEEHTVSEGTEQGLDQSLLSEGADQRLEQSLLSEGADQRLERAILSKGYSIGCRFFMGISLDQVKICASAQLNVVVSSAGLKLAKYLKKKFGTPYTIGLAEEVFVEDDIRTDQTFTEADMLLDQTFIETDILEVMGWLDFPETLPKAGDGPVLIVGDQVKSCLLRKRIMANGFDQAITVATFFGFDKELAQDDDMHFNEEADYLKLLKKGYYKTIIADKDIADVPMAKGLKKIYFPHSAV